jgi:hypothetical protein
LLTLDGSFLQIPIDLSKFEDLDSLTSRWLLGEVFKKLGHVESDSLPVCLSTLDNVAESVDFFLTKGNEPLSNFLLFDKKLKLCHIKRDELKFEKNKRVSVEEPKITDFDFIKTLGKGGFATVYMGKCLFYDDTF